VSSGLTLSGTPSPVPTSSSSTNVDPSKSHKARKKKKKNKHKHKHKHKHDRQERERGRDSKERYSSTGVSSPMVPSVQSMTSVTSMSSVILETLAQIPRSLKWCKHFYFECTLLVTVYRDNVCSVDDVSYVNVVSG
jgi:hypothetical protein